MRTPIILRFTAEGAVHYGLKSGGTTSTISYCLPQAFDCSEDHAVKIIRVLGNSQPISIATTFTELQSLNFGPSHVIGSSDIATNVYVLVNVLQIAPVGWLSITPLLPDSPPLILDPLDISLHLCPVNKLHLFKH